MKNIVNLKLIAPSLILLIAVSCEDMLDREIITGTTEEAVASNERFMEYMVASVYSELPSNFQYIDGAMLASATDEAEHTIQTSAIQRFNTGDWNQFYNPDDAWGHYFKGIRKANNVLKLVDNINFDIYKLDPDPAQQIVYQTKLERVHTWKYEIRFLRAFFYYELVKRYGGVPIIESVIDINSDEYTSLARNTLQECIQFITSECDSAAAALPEKLKLSAMGRASKGAALALKSEVLLYAASDLANSPGWANGVAVEFISLPPGDRNERWKKAADVALEVNNLTRARYELSESYPDIFLNFDDPEIILARRNGYSNSFEAMSFSPGFEGQGGTAPSQNLVDIYEVVDPATGTSMPFDWSNPDHTSDPFANRDPRLGYNVITNNSEFKGRTMEIWTGGRDGKGNARATPTGYYLKKYVNPIIDLVQSNTSVHSWVFSRLAGVYLNYAEALNEYDPGNPDIKQYIDLIRNRVGMPPTPDGLSQGEMRQWIRDERLRELAFEGGRIWDLRRWMTAPQVLSEPIRGLEINIQSDSTFSYNVIKVEDRVFREYMYFYPIPFNEISIFNWIQNPGW